MKKTLLISLIAGLFLAFTACGPEKDEPTNTPGDPADTPQAEEASHTIYSQVLRVVTVASGDASVELAAAGDCVEVPQSKLAGLVVSVQWDTAEGAAPQVLCGGEGDDAVACTADHVKVTRKEDGSGAEFSASNVEGCTSVLGETAEAAEEGGEEEGGEEEGGEEEGGEEEATE